MARVRYLSVKDPMQGGRHVQYGMHGVAGFVNRAEIKKKRKKESSHMQWHQIVNRTNWLYYGSNLD
jgi:hypothetical protein